MKDQLLKVLRLVEEGKLKPEDAVQLIMSLGYFEDDEAVQEDETDNQDRKQKAWEHAKTLFDALEETAKSAFQRIDLKKLEEEIRSQTKYAYSGVKKTVETLSKSNFWAKVNIISGALETKDSVVELNLQKGSKLVLDSNHGNIRIVGGAEKAIVHAAVDIRASSKEIALEKINSWNLDIQESDNGAVVRTPKPDGAYTASVDFDIRLPSGVTVEIKSNLSNVSIANTDASVSVEVVKGDVDVLGADESVNIIATSGKIAVKETMATQMHVETKNGHIVIGNASGLMHVKSANGDIAVEKVKSHSLTVETINGDATIELIEPITGALTARVVNGDVLVKTPDGGSCAVALATVKGDVSCTLPSAADVESGERYWRGVFGEGSGKMDINVVRGDITVELSNADTQEEEAETEE